MTSPFSDDDVLNLQYDIARIVAITLGNTARLNRIEKELTAMAAREDQAFSDLNATIQTVKEGWASLIAERDALKAALEAADADAAAQVQAALDADSDVDAAKVEAADAALAELVATPEPPAA